MMRGKIITKGMVKTFEAHLTMEEKSKSTIKKYLHELSRFLEFLDAREVAKELVILYKESIRCKYKPRSVNAALSSLNSFFSWLERPDLCVKQLKIQQQAFCPENMELTKEEYRRLVMAAGKSGNRRLEMVIQTLCGTGIRVSELCFITVQAVKQGYAEVACKGKNRVVMIPDTLREKLSLYMRERGIQKGYVFITRSGKPVDRSNIWREMKALRKTAVVSEKKIFPHNLRHLFARSFYAIEKDIVKLADVLGHSNINTTRIYMISTGREHLRQLNALGLIV